MVPSAPGDGVRMPPRIPRKEDVLRMMDLKKTDQHTQTIKKARNRDSLCRKAEGIACFVDCTCKFRSFTSV